MLTAKTILLVEDDSDHALLTVRALRKCNLANELVHVGDGAEALDYLNGTGAWQGKNPALPQVVLLDLKLPKVDGLEVLRQMRSDERTRPVPVVILTSSDEERDVVAGYRLGANSYVRKPVNFDQFMEATRQLGLYWLVLNEPPVRR